MAAEDEVGKGKNKSTDPEAPRDETIKVRFHAPSYFWLYLMVGTSCIMVFTLALALFFGLYQENRLWT